MSPSVGERAGDQEDRLRPFKQSKKWTVYLLEQVGSGSSPQGWKRLGCWWSVARGQGVGADTQVQGQVSGVGIKILGQD